MGDLDKYNIPKLSNIQMILEESNHYDLLPEVVVWSLMAMKEDNSLTIEEALLIGYNEWIK